MGKDKPEKKKNSKSNDIDKRDANRFTVFLNKNKIYFEILSTIAIIFIAIQANKLISFQNRLSIKNSQPHFRIENIEKDNLSIIKIDHLSGYYQNLSCEIVSKISFWHSDSTGSNSNDFYIINNATFPFQPNLTEGIMNVLHLEKNDSLINEVNKRFKKYSLTRYSASWIWLKTYLKLGYLDVNNSHQVLYFDISIDNGFLIEDKYGEELFDNLSHHYYALEDMDSTFFERNITPHNTQYNQ